MAEKVIAPVLFFGYDNRFLPDSNTAEVKHEDDSAPAMFALKKDFRPRPIIEEPKQPAQPEARDESPKASSATGHASGSGDGSQTSQPDSPADPADPNAGKEQSDPLSPPALL